MLQHSDMTLLHLKPTLNNVGKINTMGLSIRTFLGFWLQLQLPRSTVAGRKAAAHKEGGTSYVYCTGFILLAKDFRKELARVDEGTMV